MKGESPYRRRRRSGQSAYRAADRIVMSSRKDLVRLDTRTIRKKAIQEHRKAERALDQFKADLKRYHEKDVPGFCAWMHQNFGHLMTQQRELEKAIREKMDLSLEIHSIAERYNLLMSDAYVKVEWRRAHPEEAEAEDRKYEEELRKHNDEMFGKPPGDDSGMAEDWGDDDIFGEDEAAFEEFSEEMLGRAVGAHRGKGAHLDQKTLKELYRNIVRRLHPDHHGHMSEARAALWNEAQEAYRRHDLNALHNILARCDSGGTGIGDHTPVSLIRRMTAQLKEAARSMRREIRSVCRGPAWNYETRVADGRVVRGIEREIQGVVTGLRGELAEISGWLTALRHEAQWRADARAHHRRPNRRRAASRPRSEADLAADELPF